jgi:hypothetical protein
MTNDLHLTAPNTEQIRKHATRVVRGRIPASVRKELMNSVKLGLLGHLKRDGLKPEIFFHPDHANGAKERQNHEAAYSVKCIATVMVSGADKVEYDFPSNA